MEDFNGGPDFGQRFQDIKNERRFGSLENKNKSKEQIRKDETSLAQQLLFLHYLGLLNDIDLTTKDKSILLSKILNRSYDNIRKNLTYINSPKISHSKIKNLENLERILDIFLSLKMSEIADKVKVDLNKLNQL